VQLPETTKENKQGQVRSLNMFCSSCHALLGFFNFRTVAATLLKWQLTCNSESGGSPSISECLAATLTSTIARSGSSKSLIIPITETVLQKEPSQEGVDNTNEEGTVIHIWVLNSSIVYSSSSSSGGSIPAMKLLYRLLPHSEAEHMLEEVTCEAQEVNLPAEAIGEVIKCLDKSTTLLPKAERVFKEWQVGLLTR